MSDDASDGLAVINVDRLSRDVNAIVQASVMIDSSFEDDDTDESSAFGPQRGHSPEGDNLSQVYFRSGSFDPATSVEGTSGQPSHHMDTQAGCPDITGKLVQQLNKGAVVDMRISEHMSSSSPRYLSFPETAASLSHLRPILPAPLGMGDCHHPRTHGASVRSIHSHHIDSVTSQLERELGMVGQRSADYARVACPQPVTSSHTDVTNFPSDTTLHGRSIQEYSNPGSSPATDIRAQSLVGLNAPGPLNVQVPTSSSLHFLNSLNSHSAQNLLAQMALLSPGNPDNVGPAGLSQASSLQSLLSPYSQSSLLPYLLRTMASLNQSGGSGVELNLLTDTPTTSCGEEIVTVADDLRLPQGYPRNLSFPGEQDTNAAPSAIPGPNQGPLQPVQSFRQAKLSSQRPNFPTQTTILGVAEAAAMMDSASREVVTLAPSIITSSIHSLCLPAPHVPTSAQNAASLVNASRNQLNFTTTPQLPGTPVSRGQGTGSFQSGPDLQGLAMRIPNIPPATHLPAMPAHGGADLVDEFWCAHCDESMPQVCPRHGPPTTIPDTPIQTRARMTLPASLYLKRSSISKEFIGVWAKGAFKPGCQFGPMEGILVKKLASDADVLSPYIWKIFQNGKVRHYLDVKNEDVSNWMMFVRRARKLEEQNLAAHQVKGRLYYTTKREIDPGEELLLWFNREYAQMAGATVLPEDSFKCALCGRQFCYRQELESHTLYRHPSTSERKHTCGTCGKVFSTSSKLKVHTFKHTGNKPYSCKTCHKSFTDASNLKRHFRIHSGEKQFQCSVCLMSFRQKAHLVTHSVLHTGEKKLKCQLCGRTFARQADVVKHMQLHSGDKKQQCSLCPSTFARKSHLRRHMLTHTRERNFACDFCEKTYQTQSHLWKHRRDCKKRIDGIQAP